MILGIKELEAELDKMAKVNLRKGIESGIALVQEAAKSNCDGFRQPTGELRESIYTDVEENGDAVTGTCFTNKEYAPYVEFGTGPAGQEKHDGISPEVPVAYSQEGWMMPGTAMPPEKAAAYGLGIAKSGDNIIGYYTNGQPAKPFMYPALKDHEKDVEEIIAEKIKEQL